MIAVFVEDQTLVLDVMEFHFQVPHSNFRMRNIEGKTYDICGVCGGAGTECLGK